MQNERERDLTCSKMQSQLVQWSRQGVNPMQIASYGIEAQAEEVSLSSEAGNANASSLTVRARILAAYGMNEELLVELRAQLREERAEDQRRRQA